MADPPVETDEAATWWREWQLEQTRPLPPDCAATIGSMVTGLSTAASLYTSYWAEAHQSRLAADYLLGGKEDRPGLPWTPFSRTSLLADVQFPIIGGNFLRQNRLLADPTANPLMDTLSFESFPTVTEQGSAVAAVDSPTATAICASIAPVFKWVLDRFPEVVNPEKRLPTKTKHGMEHHI